MDESSIQDATTNPSSVNGIDVSHFQGSIDWGKVAAQGIAFGQRWMFWQHTDRGKVSGINVSVDLDKFNRTMNELERFAQAQNGSPTDWRIASPRA